MTILVAVRDQAARCTWIGADSQVSCGPIAVPATAEKWRRDGRYAVGVTGWTRAIDLIRCAGSLFAGYPEPDEVASRIRKLVLDDGWRPEEEPGPFGVDGAFIIVAGDEVYDLDGRFALTRIAPNALWARGSGQDFALGAAHAAAAVGASPNRQVAMALEAAAAFCRGCGGPLVIDRVPWG